MGKRTIIPTLKSTPARRGLPCLVLVAFGLGSSAAFALDLMGPPASGLKQGQFHAGVDYSYSQMDLKLTEGRWIEYLDHSSPLSGKYAESFTLKDFKLNKAHVNIGYGLADNWEGFLRLGGVNAKFGDSNFYEEGEEFDSQTDLAIGCGIKATFYEDGNLKIGGLFQVSRAELDGKMRPNGWPVAGDSVQIELTEIQIAVGPSYKLADNFLIYGGPFLHFIDGDLDDEYSAPEVDEEGTVTGFLTGKDSWAIEERSIFGGYIGAQVDLAENCSLNIECQLTSAAEAICLGLLWRF